MNSVTYDVVVVGYGCAGAMAAISASDAGARVLLIEKTAHLGGTSMLSSGFARVASDAEQASLYLARTSGERLPAELVTAFGAGMVQTPRLLKEIGKRAAAEVSVRFGADQASNETEDLYDWPGRESLGWAGIESVEGFAGYPWVKGGSKGQFLMRALEINIEQRPIDVWFETAAESLIVNSSGVIDGLRVRRDGDEVAIHTTGGVVLACGGFEFNRQMLRDYLELPELLPMGHAGNTGDGIRMALEAGAALWHMWHIHGSYGYRLPGLPVAVRNPLGGARNPARTLNWILVDQKGKRFTNELPPAPQDTITRPLSHLDEETGRYDRIPAWMIFDETGRLAGPIGRPVAAQAEHYYEWSKDNSREVESGWIKKADTIAELSRIIGLDASALGESVRIWNASVEAQKDDAFGRPPGSMAALSNPPFYAIDVWPVVSNTQGGPVHDAEQRVLTHAGRKIDGLFAAGEIGSFFGHIYLLGGNITEGISGGHLAGLKAAQRALKNSRLSETL